MVSKLVNSHSQSGSPFLFSFSITIQIAKLQSLFFDQQIILALLPLTNCSYIDTSEGNFL